MLDEATTVLLKRVMFRLLVKSNENALSQLFGRVLRESSKNELLTHGLQLFFEVVLKEEDFAEADELPIFKKRLSFVRDLLDIAEWPVIVQLLNVVVELSQIKSLIFLWAVIYGEITQLRVTFGVNGAVFLASGSWLFNWR